MRTARYFFPVFFLALAACGSDDAAMPETPVPVHVQRVVHTQAGRADRYPGAVESRQRVQLGSRIMGRIARLSVEEGDCVRRGQVLVRLRDDDVQAQAAQVRAALREAEAALESAGAQYRRMKVLFEAESATRKEYEDAATGYEQAQARLEVMRGKLAEVGETLAHTVVTAPIDGCVVQKNAAVGDLALPGRPLLVVEDLHRLKVVARVPEGDVHRIAVGDTVSLEVDALGGRALAGIVGRRNPSGDPESRQFDVHVELPGDVPALKPGMYARMLLPGAPSDLVTVPASALVRRGQLTGLFVLDPEQRAFLRWVRTGRQTGDRVEVLAGLSEGETYVVAAEGRLVDGQPVRVLN